VKYNRIVRITVWFLAGIISAVIVPNLVRAVLDRVIFPERTDEVSRVTSPDGIVDAVVIRSHCGAPCSTNYSVFVVPKGREVGRKADQRVFSADDLTGQLLTWKKAHLLEIAYGRALILSFQNVTYPFLRAGQTNSYEYRVEMRLAPTSPGFSYLKDEDAQ
jgi:hypothetical protein